MRISAILEKIDENQLFVPAFQREYVWKRDDAKQLIDSLIKEYPTGTMLTWETASPPELKGPHKYNEKQGAVKLLLDGQQRVTTLYMLIRGIIPPYYTAPEIMNDTRDLFVQLETRELSYYMKTRMENNPLWQNITNVFQRKIRAWDVVRELEKKGETVTRERQDKIDDNTRAIENILSREFPEQTIPVKASIREAIDIFYKVNASGVALTDAELALAQISGYWPQARNRFKAKLAALEKEGYVFKLDFIVYVLLGCLYHMGSDMRKLHDAENDEKIRAAWNRLETQVLDYVVNLMRANAFVDHGRDQLPLRASPDYCLLLRQEWSPSHRCGNSQDGEVVFLLAGADPLREPVAAKTGSRPAHGGGVAPAIRRTPSSHRGGNRSLGNSAD